MAVARLLARWLVNLITRLFHQLVNFRSKHSTIAPSGHCEGSPPHWRVSDLGYKNVWPPPSTKAVLHSHPCGSPVSVLERMNSDYLRKKVGQKQCLLLTIF